jgi:hypothetical protein
MADPLAGPGLGGLRNYENVPDSSGGRNFEPDMQAEKSHRDLRLDESGRKSIMEIHAAA